MLTVSRNVLDMELDGTPTTVRPVDDLTFIGDLVGEFGISGEMRLRGSAWAVWKDDNRMKFNEIETFFTQLNSY